MNYRLIAVSDRNLAALIDTQFQMKAFEAAVQKRLIPWLRSCQIIKRNFKVHSSVLDYLMKCNNSLLYLEVKSATFRDNEHVAMYPDRSSIRCRKHIRELISLTLKGNSCALVFIAALPYVKVFKPNRLADEKLYELVKKAAEVGVTIKAISVYFNLKDSTVYLDNPDLKVDLT